MFSEAKALQEQKICIILVIINPIGGRIMWTRAELKTRAKEVFKANYWKAVLTALILGLVSGGGSGITSQNVSNSYSDAAGESFTDIFTNMDPQVLITVVSLVIGVVAVGWIVSILLSVFVFQPIEVGAQRFFVKCDKEQPGLGEIVFAFKNSYGNVVKTMFLQALYIFLWSLLFIIPGIIKSYEYLMVPYLLAENPDMDSKEAFARSKEMMMGEKWNAFVLGLSFLGWQILAVFTCGILSIFYVNPYYHMTFAQLYEVLKQKSHVA